jgi:hypothetical protein
MFTVLPALTWLLLYVVLSLLAWPLPRLAARSKLKPAPPGPTPTLTPTLVLLELLLLLSALATWENFIGRSSYFVVEQGRWHMQEAWLGSQDLSNSLRHLT